MPDDAPLLEPGLRFGKDTSLRTRLRSWLQQRKPPPPPSSNWTLQYTGQQWALLLSSYGPGDLGLPPVLINSGIGEHETDQALAWAHSALPAGVQHTIRRV